MEDPCNNDIYELTSSGLKLNYDSKLFGLFSMHDIFKFFHPVVTTNDFG